MGVVSKVQTKTDEPGLSQGVAPPALIADGVKEDDDDDMFEAPSQGKVIAVNAGEGEAKVDFLNKIVSCVSFSLDEPINVAANKIVAGLDADKTNGFLVKLHQAATTTVGP